MENNFGIQRANASCAWPTLLRLLSLAVITIAGPRNKVHKGNTVVIATQPPR